MLDLALQTNQWTEQRQQHQHVAILTFRVTFAEFQSTCRRAAAAASHALKEYKNSNYVISHPV